MLEAITRFVWGAGYLWGLMVIIFFCTAHIKTNIFFKVLAGIALFFILNIPLSLSISLKYDGVENITSILLFSYLLSISALGIISIIRDYYRLYTRKKKA